MHRLSFTSANPSIAIALIGQASAQSPQAVQAPSSTAASNGDGMSICVPN
jgi:hypothetical protein